MNNWQFDLFGINAPFISEDTFSEKTAAKVLRQRNIKQLDELLNMCGNDWNLRYFYVLAMSRNFPMRRIERWVKNQPESMNAFLVYGARLLKVAWNARGYGLGREVSRDQWDNFYQLLEDAEVALLRAAELHPLDPTPWVFLIMTAIYSGDRDDDETTYFIEATQRDTENWHAHINRLTGLTQKYGGSHEWMFEFARDCRQSITSHSLLNCLILKAHSEFWKYKLYFEEDCLAAQKHRTDSAAIDECLDAYNSSLLINKQNCIETLFPRINAAGTFWIFGQKAPLKKELSILGNHISDIHWRWVGVEDSLKDAQKFAFDR